VYPPVVVIPVTADKAPEETINPLIVSVLVRAVIVPLASTPKFDPLITVGPVASPKVRVPVPLALKVNPVLTVEEEITGDSPANVKAVEEKVLLL
jgi:hypothetical protein